MAGYLGAIPVPQATQTRQTFTATSGQTSFATAGYTAGFVDVYMNGVRLVDGTDFTATNGSDVVLTSGAATGDIIDVLMFTAVDLATAVGGGRYKGERGTLGPAAAAGDIFRVSEQTLNTNVTIDATENASATGPLAVASGVTLTVTSGGNLSIV
jgi:hypothetical protein|tara:strand:+ start:74 stop:538 length:465 start_codon:yes stop_codon:yes gene_type:complete